MLDSPPRSGGCDMRLLFVSDTHIGLASTHLTVLSILDKIDA